MQNKNKVESTKDRQERAIYAFTIVTIIFLPLSSVASIFGINTKDVRDMDLSQWAYWATAIPVTAVVVFFGLLWTGELGNIIRWVFSFGSQARYYRQVSHKFDDDDLHYYRMRLAERERSGSRERWATSRRRSRSPAVGYFIPDLHDPER